MTAVRARWLKPAVKSQKVRRTTPAEKKLIDGSYSDEQYKYLIPGSC
jgi:hypothetical protein